MPALHDGKQPVGSRNRKHDITTTIRTCFVYCCLSLHKLISHNYGGRAYFALVSEYTSFIVYHNLPRTQEDGKLIVIMVRNKYKPQQEIGASLGFDVLSLVVYITNQARSSGRRRVTASLHPTSLHN